MTGEVGQRERRHPATRGRVDSREQSVAHERHVSAALALVPALLSLLVMIACGAALSRERPWWAQRDDRPIAPRPHGSAWPMLFPVLVLLIAVAVPVTGLVVRAQSVSNLADAWRGARDEVVHSAWLASVGAIATLVLAIPLAHAWVASARVQRPSASPLALLNLAVPGSLLALGILALPAPRCLINTNQDSFADTLPASSRSRASCSSPRGCDTRPRRNCRRGCMA